MDRGAWGAIDHGVTELDTTEQQTLSLSHELAAAKKINFSNML